MASAPPCPDIIPWRFGGTNWWFTTHCLLLVAGGSGGLHTALKAVAAAVLPYLPPGLLPYLPRTLTTALRRLAKEDDEDKGLPT